MAIEFIRPNGAQNLNTGTNDVPINKNTHQNSDSLSKADNTRVIGEPVQLSQSARDLQSIYEKLNQIPSINQSKVQQLKQAITDGSYQVDSARLANKLLNFEKQF